VRLIEGFDTYWFKPGVDNSLAPIIPKWGFPVPDFSMPKTALNLASLWWILSFREGTKAIRAPLSVYTQLNKPDFVLGLRFARTTDAPALLFSVWEGEPTKTGSRLICGVWVDGDGIIRAFSGGSWDRERIGFGLSGHTEIGSSGTFALPITDEMPRHYLEFAVKIEANGNILGQSRVSRLNGSQIEVLNSFSFTGSISPPPSPSNLFLWIASNYSYRDASNNYTTAHGYDDLYLIENDGIAPSNVMIGPCNVYTLRPQSVKVAEWYATQVGHVAPVSEDWVSHPSNDLDYIHTDAFPRREIWSFGKLKEILGDNFIPVVFQLTGWVNLQEHTKGRLAIVVRKSESPWDETWFTPNEKLVSDISGNIGFITRCFIAFSEVDPDNLDFGVVTL